MEGKLQAIIKINIKTHNKNISADRVLLFYYYICIGNNKTKASNILTCRNRDITSITRSYIMVVEFLVLFGVSMLFAPLFLLLIC